MKGTDIDKALCEHLKKYHQGQESAASSRELEAAFHLKGTELRRVINRLRCNSSPICSDATGYFYAKRPSEIKATVAQLSGRISKISAAAKGLMKSYEETEG